MSDRRPHEQGLAGMERLIETATLKVHELAAKEGHLPALDHPDVGRAVEPLVCIEEETEDGTRRYLRDVPDDVIETFYEDSGRRVAIAAWLYALAHAKAEDARISAYMDDAVRRTTSGEEDNEEDFVPDEDLDALRRFLDHRTPDRVPPDARLWEIHAAGLAQYPERVISICDRLALDPTPENLAICARAGLLALATVRVNPFQELFVPVWWDSSLEFDNDLWVSAWALAAPFQDLTSRLHRDAAGLQPAPPPHLVLKVRHWIDLLATRKNLDETERAISAWTRYAQGLGADGSAALAAGREYSELADRVSEPRDVLVPRALAAAASCFLAAERADLAEESLRRRLDLSNDDPSATLQLALCLYLQEKESELLEVFERYVKLTPAAAPQEDFARSLALKFGLLARTRAKTQEILVSAAMESPRREQGEALAAWVEPFYEHLSEEARRRWWTALHLLSSPDIVRMVGDDAWFRVAADFAEAANLELRGRVFKPFRKRHEAEIAAERIDSDTAKERRRALQGQGALGQNVRVLKEAVYPQNRVDELLEKDLSTFHPHLRRHLEDANARKRLDELVALRNLAAHDVVNRQQARRTYELARELMSVVVKAPVQ